MIPTRFGVFHTPSNALIGLSRIAIFSAVEASLKRLDTPYIDLLQIHRFDYNTPIEETMEALHDLVRSGKVRYIGASSMWATQFAQMQHAAEKRGWTKFISMQNQYSLLYREEEREMNRYCNDTGVGLIPWAPLAAGRLARPAESFSSTDRAKTLDGLTENDAKIVKRVEEIAAKKGKPSLPLPNTFGSQTNRVRRMEAVSGGFGLDQ